MFNWVTGTGCVPINNLMEDAATVEISRTLIWQWVKHGVVLEDGTKVDKDLISKLINQISESVEIDLNIHKQNDLKLYKQVVEILKEVCTNTDNFCEFITLPLYDLL